MPVAQPVVAPVGREELGLPKDAWLAGLAFDYGSVAERKNPLGAIEAFTRAFGPGDGAALVVKTLRSDTDPAAHRAVLDAAGAHPHVHVIDRDLPAAEKNALIGLLDCLLSVHRSEGFGLALAEAALLGVPVVATDYGGHARLPDAVQRVAGRPPARPHRPGTRSLPARRRVGGAGPRPRGRAAACRARRAGGGARGGRRGRGRTSRAAHDPSVAGAAMAARLARIVRAPVAAAGGPVDGLDLGAARTRVRDRPGSRRGGRRAGSAARRASCGRSRPYAVHQRIVDEELLRALQTLDERVRGLAAAPVVAGRRGGQAAPRARGLVASPGDERVPVQPRLHRRRRRRGLPARRPRPRPGRAAATSPRCRRAASRCGPRRSTSGCPRCTATTARARR